MASCAAEFVVDLNLGPDDIAYAVRILGVRRAVVERDELPRVASLGLDVLVLEDILARPVRDIASPPFDPRAWGKTAEAAMAAAHYRLDNLVVCVDNNKLETDGKTVWVELPV